jgi:hypothetical protein
MVAANRERMETRRARVFELKMHGFRLARIAQTCLDEGLCPTNTLGAAYALIRNDIAALKKEAARRAVDDADGTVDFVREMYVAQLSHVLSDAFDAMSDGTLPPNVQLGYAKLAMEAAEKLAGVEGVNVRPRFMPADDASDAVDPAVEAARAVMRKRREREAEEALAAEEQAAALKAGAPTSTN